MARTFVWHPTRGPKKTAAIKLPKAGKVRIKQVKSGIGHPARTRATLAALGLRHHQDEVEQAVSHSLAGQLKKVRHLIEVTPVEE